LDSYEFSATASSWDISDFIKTTGQDGQPIAVTSYVIKETVMDQTAAANYTKAWDFRFTYTGATSTIEKVGTDVG
jgi:hypothetical protein